MLARGRRGGAPAAAVVELIDRYDEATGFTAMERTTGWDGSIKAILNARGVTPRGAHPAEIAVPGPLYAGELRRRGFSLTEPGGLAGRSRPGEGPVIGGADDPGDLSRLPWAPLAGALPSGRAQRRAATRPAEWRPRPTACATS